MYFDKKRPITAISKLLMLILLSTCSFAGNQATKEVDSVDKILDAIIAEENTRIAPPQLPIKINHETKEIIFTFVDHNHKNISREEEYAKWKAIDLRQANVMCQDGKAVLMFVAGYYFVFNYQEPNNQSTLHTQTITPKTCGIDPDSIKLLKKAK